MFSAKVTESLCFDLAVGGVVFNGFTVQDSWNGVVKVVNSAGEFMLLAAIPQDGKVIKVYKMSLNLYASLPPPVLSLDLDSQEFKPTHTHNNTGNKYQLFAVSNEQATKPEWGQQAVYTDGKTLWTRPIEQFRERYNLIG